MTDFKKEYRKLVGKVIAARKRCGRSQIACCKEAGISQAGWWEVEAGVNLPKIENLAAIASVLGCWGAWPLMGGVLQNDTPPSPVGILCHFSQSPSIGGKAYTIRKRGVAR